MKALTYIALFPFDYLFDRYVISLWVVLSVFAVLVVVVLSQLRTLKRVWRWTRGPAHEENAPSKGPPGSSDFSSLKKSIDDLNVQQDNLVEHVAAVESAVRNMQVELDRLKQRTAAPGQNRNPHNDDQDRSSGTLDIEYANVSSSSSSTTGYYSPGTGDGWPESYSDMTELYNASRTDPSSRTRFWEKYKPFFIKVANDVDRRRNASVPPDFRKEVDGSYLAVPQANDEAAIFPNFTLVVLDAVYGPGALAEAFDCGTFDSSCSYSDISVERPATFTLTGGQSWRVSKKGKLDLGTGQEN